jgi:signal transduction histidine kinase
VVVANGITGFVLERFRREEELVRAERTMQLAAEERVRSDTARYLHDDVQTALLRASLRLVPLVERTPDLDDQALLRAAIAEIDTVRDEGVRAVGRRLSPPLSSIGLIVALNELAGSYAGVMRVDVEFDAAAAERFRIVGEDDRTALAIYRLSEQALQNALKHGRASTAHIRVSVSDGTPTTLLVTADGTAPARDRVAGNVTAIINAWLDDVGGTWSLDADESGGSSFRATIGDDARSE